MGKFNFEEKGKTVEGAKENKAVYLLQTSRGSAVLFRKDLPKF